MRRDLLRDARSETLHGLALGWLLAPQLRWDVHLKSGVADHDLISLSLQLVIPSAFNNRVIGLRQLILDFLTHDLGFVLSRDELEGVDNLVNGRFRASKRRRLTLDPLAWQVRADCADTKADFCLVLVAGIIALILSLSYIIDHWTRHLQSIETNHLRFCKVSFCNFSFRLAMYLCF